MCVFSGARLPVPGVDILIVRENTECLYVKRETLSADGNTAIAERQITRHVCRANYIAERVSLIKYLNRGFASRVLLFVNNVLSPKYFFCFFLLIRLLPALLV